MRSTAADTRASIDAVQTSTGVAVVTAHGELDIAAVPELRQRLEEAVGTGVPGLLLDLCDVTFIDSVSLAAVVAARRRMGEPARLAIATGHPYVMLILEAGGLDSVIEVYPSRSEAEAALA